MSSEKPVLYSYWRSSCSWRVRIALHWKEIDYEYVAVHLVKDGGEQLKPEFKKLNPYAELPVLVVNGHTLSQSVAIMEYLEETNPNNPLLPRDPLERVKVRTIVEAICGEIQPLQNLRVLNKIGEKKMEWAKEWIERGFVALEQNLYKTAGKYCVGDEVTIADACLVPQVYNALRFGVDMTQFPIITRIEAALSTLPAFQKAHPDSQPDCPPPAPAQ
eukprot:Colp12_sorted_trinity150504_noHs@10861